MRVVFFSAARQVWGAEVSLLTLAASLAARGVATALVCPEGELAERALAAGIPEVHPVPMGSSATGRRPQEAARLWWRYLRHARSGDRLVIFSYYLLLFAPAARPWLRARGVRVVLDLHDHLPGAKARRAVELCSRGVDAVIACSSFTADQLRELHPNVAHLHRPVAPEVLAAGASRRFTRAPRPSEAPGPSSGPDSGSESVSESVAGEPAVLRVGVIGRITREKRHHLVIEALERIGPDARLVVRGGDDGFSEEHAREVVREGRERLGDRFVSQGRVPPERAMDDLDVVVVGNPYEPMGRTVLEAQSHGVVAVVPDSGGSRELVEDGVTGLVYAHDDPADLARTLERVAGDAALAARLAEAAVLRVPRPEEYAGEYLRLIG